MSVVWPDAAAIIRVAEPLIIAFESFEPRPYLCPAGKPTIGYGSLKYPDGRKVQLTDQPCSELEARVWLLYGERRTLADLQASGAVMRPPSVNQAAAFLCLAYNVGVGIHDGHKGDLADSTLLDHFNRGDLAGAADEFPKWSKAHVDGELVTLPGLLRRREAEMALFLRPDAIRDF